MSAPALGWQALTVRYGARTALSLGPVSLQGGQLVALLGPNGSGKSSLLKALIGAVSADVTGLVIAGRDAAQLSRNARARSLAYLSQDRTGPGLATVRDVVALGRFAHAGAEEGARVDAVMDRLDLADFAHRRFGQLSGGERARVLLARALAVGAPVLLADEPTAALDPRYALATMRALKAEAQGGALVVASLHDLDLAMRFADRVMVLNEGRLASETLDAATLRGVFGVERTASGALDLS